MSLPVNAMMKSTAVLCAITAASLGCGSLSFAQGWDRDGRHGREAGAGEQRDQRQWQGGQRQQVEPQRQFMPRGQQPRYVQPQYVQPQYGQPRYGQPRFAQQPQYVAPAPQYGPEWQNRQFRQFRHDGPRFDQYRQGGFEQHAHQPRWSPDAPRFRRGDFLPYEYRQRQFLVNDWRAHRLYAPPPGYQWVQTDGGDFLLIAIATGLIANMMIGQ